MEDEYRFSYQPGCQFKGCERRAVLKVAAPWSDGTRSELKNYGTFCELHGPTCLVQARRRREGLRLADGESIGPVQLYRLRDGQRDAELQPLSDSP